MVSKYFAGKSILLMSSIMPMEGLTQRWFL